MATSVTVRLATSVSVIASLFLLPPPACAQATPRKANSLNQSFDNRIERLPSNFSGHSFDEVFSPLWSEISKIKKKSDYETEAQYRDRVGGELDSVERRLLSRFKVGNPKLAFVVKPNMSYSAESAQFSAEFELGSLSSAYDYLPDSKPSVWTVLYSERVHLLGKYYVRNLLGQTFEITRTDVLRKYIAIRACQMRRGERSTVDLAPLYNSWRRVFGTLTLDAPPQRAEKMHSNIRWLLIVENIDAPFASQEKGVANPSLEYRIFNQGPYENRELVVQIESLWMFDVKTGEVLKKVPACSVRTRISEPKNPSVPLGDVEIYLF
jgi:hypothetical protein